MNIVLIGLMGTGKTAVGQALAERLSWAFYDTDRMIEKETGLTIAQIFAKRGEAPFRELETQTVRLLGILDRVIIATGGGVPLRDENMRELEKNGFVVWLKAEPETILDRLEDHVETRPLLADKDPLEAIQELLAAREEAYKRCRASVATDDLDPEEVAQKILALIGPQSN
jgi:shikimate kinase